jgi:hypothetical protein
MDYCTICCLNFCYWECHRSKFKLNTIKTCAKNLCQPNLRVFVSKSVNALWTLMHALTLVIINVVALTHNSIPPPMAEPGGARGAMTSPFFFIWAKSLDFLDICYVLMTKFLILHLLFTYHLFGLKELILT